MITWYNVSMSEIIYYRPEPAGRHYCYPPTPSDKLLGHQWTCPLCYTVWVVTIDEDGECAKYWDRDSPQSQGALNPNLSVS